VFPLYSCCVGVVTIVSYVSERAAPIAHEPMAFTASLSLTTPTLSSGRPIIFDHVVTNIGTGYNHHGGIFTARVPGVYVFSVEIDLHGGSSIGVQVVQDGRELCTAFTTDTTADGSGGCLATAHLSVGSDVWVRQYANHGMLEGGHWSSFSGFLIYADESK
jgi:hypothetical protein